MPSYLTGARSARRTPETEAIMGREDEMKRNAAGGFAFAITPLQTFRRWLILGSEHGTYYTDSRKLTTTNVAALERLVRDGDGAAALEVIVAVATAGRSARDDQALWALAYLGSQRFDEAVQEAALRKLPEVATTGAKLFQFAGFLTEMRGWGIRPRMAVRAWYEQRDDQCPHCKRIGSLRATVDLPDQPPRRRAVRCAGCTAVFDRRELRGVDWLAHQMVKYRSREGSKKHKGRKREVQPWTHKRLIDLSHPVPPTPEHEALYQFALGMTPTVLHDKVAGFRWAQLAETPAQTVAVIRERPWLPWEALRSEHTSDPDVMTALINNRMPMGALIRQLGRFTAAGILGPMDDLTVSVAKRITDPGAVSGAKVHPVAILKALTTYESGQGARARWQPSRQIVDALGEAFYLAYGNVPSSGKRTLLCIDVSGSMTAEGVAGMQNLSARAGAAAMALVTANTEERYDIVAFSSRVRVREMYTGRFNPDVYALDGADDWCIAPLAITPRMRIADAMKVCAEQQAGATDLSLPFLYAQQHGLSVDTFVVYTDNESFRGRMHPSQALRHYRESTGIKDARLVVVAMSAVDYSVADPRDRGMLDVVGFDTAAPGIISAFSRGEV